MNWILFALAGPIFWALSNIIDERLVQKLFKEPLGLTVITGLFNTLPLVVIPFFSFPTWEGNISVIAFIAGVLGIAIYYPYLKALQITNAAITIILWNFVPIFVLITSYFFLREILMVKDYVAIFLLIFASLLVTVNKTDARIPWKPLALMGAASLLYTIELTTEKFVYEHTPFLNGYWWFCLGELTTAICVLALHKRTRQILINRLEKRFFVLNLSNEALNGVGNIFVSAAVSLGPVAVVNAVGKIQPLIVLAAAGVIAHVAKNKQTQAWKPEFVVRVIFATALSAVAIVLAGSKVS